MPDSATQRLAELGIELPAPPPAAGSYVAAVETGELLLTSGQIAVAGDAGLVARGRVGAEVDLETAKACARQCALNVLAQLSAVLGDLDRVERVVKLTVFVASDSGFNEQHVVANGASELMTAAFGDAGLHARSAVGVASLPLESPVEVEAIVRVRADGA